ncbi:MAG TPA: ABC transporter ATP-binding protein [Candidatus Moranbacteria bacterium]|nr:ABC transporter ATP-binding protein [Candidatus Moranbacteria bacterium]
MKNETILKIENLEKSYGKLKAVDGISFSVEAGETFGLLGPNGAGKTTTINMLLGILEPTDGKIIMLGKNMAEHHAEVRCLINFAAVYAHLPSNLTVWQNLYIFGKLYEVKNLRSRIDTLMNEFDLKKFSATKAGLLSSGEFSRLNLAKAIINEPCLLLLDEPTASLDPSIAQQIREMVMAYAKKNGAAVVWTSHNMREIETVCNRVAFLSHGKILLTGDPRTLPAQQGKKDLEELFITVAREPLTLNEQ